MRHRSVATILAVGLVAASTPLHAAAVSAAPTTTAPTTPPTPSKADRDRAETCAPERAALDDLEKRIDEHNSRAPYTTDRAVVDSYNAEAEQLNAEKTSDAGAYARCQVKFGELEGGMSDSALTDLAATHYDELTALVHGVPAGWRAPTGPYAVPSGQPPNSRAGQSFSTTASGAVTVTTWTLPADSPAKPLRDSLAQLRVEPSRTEVLDNGFRPAAGDPDPAFAGATFSDGVGAERIVAGDEVSVDEIVTISGFTELTPGEMLVVANSTTAREWVSMRTELALASPSAAAVLGLDPAWLDTHDKERETALTELADTVKAILDGRHG